LVVEVIQEKNTKKKTRDDVFVKRRSFATKVAAAAVANNSFGRDAEREKERRRWKMEDGDGKNKKRRKKKKQREKERTDTLFGRFL